MTENTDKAWEKYGETDPYFGVLNLEKFRGTNLKSEVLQDFFDSGNEHIEQILSNIYKHIDPDFRAVNSLDFGCGVGRLVIPLAKISEYAVGIDVSESMLAEARKNCELNSVRNIDLVKSDDALSKLAGRKFNLIHSYIVFQHITTHRGEAILEKLLDCLEEGGVGVLHFNYASIEPISRQIQYYLRRFVPGVNGLVNIIKGRKFSYPMMQMNRYQLNRIFKILQKRNITNLYLDLTNDSFNLGSIIYFQK
jgi:ubiquinone/menaquinone biosynthesis C-methylase UbiE